MNTLNRRCAYVLHGHCTAISLYLSHLICCLFASPLLPYANTQLFILLFTVDMVFHVLAWGFWNNGDGSYLKRGDKRLDFAVLILSYISLIPGAGGNAWAVIRAFRLLDLIRRNPRMRLLLQSLREVLPLVQSVFVVFLFLLFCFALVGLLGFSGRLHQRCYIPSDPPTLLPSEGPDSFCSVGRAGRHCPAGSVCLPIAPNPNAGIWSFDNIGNALFSCFMSITREGWTIPLYATMQAVSGVSVLFFILLIFVVSFFASQLVRTLLLRGFIWLTGCLSYLCRLFWMFGCA